MLKENVIEKKRFHSGAKCLNTKSPKLSAVLENPEKKRTAYTFISSYLLKTLFLI